MQRKEPHKKAAKMIGNINLHTTVTLKLFFLPLLIFILYDMHKALEGPPFQRQKYEELMPEKLRDQRGKIAQKCVSGYGCYIFWKPHR